MGRYIHMNSSHGIAWIPPRRILLTAIRLILDNHETMVVFGMYGPSELLSPISLVAGDVDEEHVQAARHGSFKLAPHGIHVEPPSGGL
jgi:hypothetical protein